MNEATSPKLTLSQKLRLAAGVFAIYWPIRLYVNVYHWNVPFLLNSWLLWSIEIPLTILFFTGWLAVTEWLEEKLARRSGRDFLINLKWPAQLATLLVAGALAAVFNSGFNELTYRVYSHVAEYRTLLDFREERAGPKPNRVSGTRPTEQDARLKWVEIAKTRRTRINSGLTIMAMLMAFYLAANRRGYRELTQLRVRAEQLGREAAQAQFAALRNQVNPHFLFNSLSILSSLVEVDAKLSVQFINRLSKAYRYILEQRDAERVPLRTELDFIESYTFLLRIRFDERLQVRINMADTDRDRYQIAPLTLQLLVENAVKHNRMSDEAPLWVSIDRAGDYLRVANPLQLRPAADESTGVGLTNIINRYRLLTDRPVRVGEANGEFVVQIPLLMGEG